MTMPVGVSLRNRLFENEQEAADDSMVTAQNLVDTVYAYRMRQDELFKQITELEAQRTKALAECEFVERVIENRLDARRMGECVYTVDESNQLVHVGLIVVKGQKPRIVKVVRKLNG